MSERGGYKMTDLNIEGALKLSNTMAAKGAELEALLDATEDDGNVTLTQKQLTDILILVGRLTLINTGINGAHLEESALQAQDQSFFG
jgi:CRISPR/Cas system-associated protein endoribonuclease Cas2